MRDVFLSQVTILNSQFFAFLPIPNLGAFGSVGLVRVYGPQVRAGGVMGAGIFILVRLAPRVGTQHLDVRSAPFPIVIRRLLHQRFKPSSVDG
jgi:hypothetical protein